MIKIGLLDDHLLFMDGLEAFAEGRPEIEVTFKVKNIAELRKTLVQHPVDLLLFDIRLEGESGFDAAKWVHESSLPFKPKIAFLTMSDAYAEVRQAMLLGADGYLLKSEVGEAIVKAIQQIVNGHQPYYQSQWYQKIKENNELYDQNIGNQKTILQALNNKELRTLQYLIEGKSSREIAEIMNVAYNTVRSYRQNILRKTKTNSTTELLSLVREHGLL